MNELIEWLIANKIQFNVIDSEVIDIPEFGKAYYENTDKLNSIFRNNPDGELIFNCVEEPSVLIEEDINYVVFKFGNNWYYHDLRKNFVLNILKYVGTKAPAACEKGIVNLGIHTPFELLNGSFMPYKWIEKAKFCGHKAIGICDHNTMAACYNMQKACDDAGLKCVFGYSLTFTYAEDKVGAKVYVQTQKGLRNLLRIQKAIMVDSEDQTIPFSELKRRGEGNVLVFDKYSPEWRSLHAQQVKELEEAFDKVYHQVDLTEYKAERIDIEVLNAAKFYFEKLYGNELPPVLITATYYLDKDNAKKKLILNKIAEGAAHRQSDEQFYKDADEHYALFEALFDPEVWDINAIFQECVDNANEIANNANARFENDRNFMPKYTMTPEEEERYGTTHNMFNQLLEEGFEKLVPKDKESQKKYRKQMEYEKYIIESTNNVDYLLVQYDTCNWSRKNNILVGCGRGSAAGSLLLYLLGITLIDPLRYDLIFERFLLPERAGLYPSDTTIIGQDMESCNYVEITLDGGKVVKIDCDAQLYIKRQGEEEPITIYADELQDGDEILFDNKDELFTLNEI